MGAVEQIRLFRYCKENPKNDESQVADIVEKSSWYDAGDSTTPWIWHIEC